MDPLFHHINNVDLHIKLSIDHEVNGKLLFLDLCVNVIDEGGTKITNHKKPTHTDNYLNFTSHHPVVHKRYVVRILTNRAKLHVATPDDQQAQMDHVNNASRANNYEEWVLNVPLSKPHKVEKNENKNTNSRHLMLGIPYVQGSSRSWSDN